MGPVRVKDVVLWINHIEQDDGLRRRLLDLPPDATVALDVGGRPGFWQKMLNATQTGRPTNDLKPQGPIKDLWFDLYARYNAEGGIVVPIKEPNAQEESSTVSVVAPSVIPRVPIEYPDPTVRAGALERIRALRSAGWRSTETTYDTREQWYPEDGA